ncbi:MAG: hypothetical protein ACTSUE_01925 [Promethearchaeota archaeon]
MHAKDKQFRIILYYARSKKLHKECKIHYARNYVEFIYKNTKAIEIEGKIDEIVKFFNGRTFRDYQGDEMRVLKIKKKTISGKEYKTLLLLSSHVA